MTLVRPLIAAIVLIFSQDLVRSIQYEGAILPTKPPQRQEFLWYRRPVGEADKGTPNQDAQNRGIKTQSEGKRGESWESGSSIQSQYSSPQVNWHSQFIVHPVPPESGIGRQEPPTATPLSPKRLGGKKQTNQAPFYKEWAKGVGRVDNETLYGINNNRTPTTSVPETTECTGRGHSWGCTPYGEDAGERRAEDRSKGRAEKEDVGEERGIEAERPRDKKEHLTGLYRREASESPRPSGGWTAVGDWCLLSNGQYPYPYDCRRFVNCWNGKGFVQPCAPGTLFNSETFECDFPSKVKGCSALKRDAIKSQVSKHTDSSGADTQPSGSDIHSSQLIQGENYGAGMIDIRSSNLQPTRRFRTHFNESARVDGAVTSSKSPTLSTSAPIKRQQSGTKFGSLVSKPSCPEANGIFPHPQHCDRFINCHHGRQHTMMCGPGTLFDPSRKLCDHAHKVKCNTPEEEILTPEASSYVPVLQHFEGEKGQNSSERQKSHHTRQNKSTPESTKNLTSPNIELAPKPMPSASILPLAHIPPHSMPRAVPPSKPTRPRTELQQLTEDFHQGQQPPTPPTGQQVRLKGGEWPWEGYVELYNPSNGESGNHGEWKIACDEEGKWNLNEGNVVCRQLGFHRGAEITWQGKWTRDKVMANVSVDAIQCTGAETSIQSCKLGPLESTVECNVKRRAAGVRCLKEYRSLCSVSEIPFSGRCYSLTTGEHEDASLVSRESASKECERKGGLLADINFAVENDFISEWLVNKNPQVLSFITGGVGMPMSSKLVWMWEASQFAMAYTNWWRGWNGNLEDLNPDTKTKCVVATRKYPCPEDFDRMEPSTRSDQERSVQPRWAFKQGGKRSKQCKTEYFFWSPQECNVLTNGAICKRNPYDIGCVWNLGMDYLGNANVSRSGKACISWDEGPFGSPHPDPLLRGHNYCRNRAGADGGSAAEGHPWCYIASNGTWETCEIPPCAYIDVKRTVFGGEKKQCDAKQFECTLGECIANTFVCDGFKDCSNGNDEVDCLGVLKEFRKRGGLKLHPKGFFEETLSIEKWVQTSLEDCASNCLKKEQDDKCQSFSYHHKDKQCLLVGSKTSDSNKTPELEKKHDWDHYELIPATVNCRGMFRCRNGSCVNSNKVCDGTNDCGEKSDESNCTSDSIGFAIRLSGGNVSHEGRIEIRAFGRWGVICDDLFGLADADVVCREAGYLLGAAEAVSHSGFGSGVTKGSPLFLIDDLECKGTEESVAECSFPGWGDHNCGPEEVAGVVCKIPGSICQDDEYHCQESKECIPLDYLCDNVHDCADGSDEEKDRCQSEVLVRLADGPTNLEGRVEVRYRGIWGTVCDDDFGVPDAQVICRTLGLGWGPGVLAFKDARYGLGRGPIWLDELHCSGEEEKLLDCPKFPWGKNNCGHKEDASVKCTSPGDVGILRKSNAAPFSWAKKSQEETVDNPRSAADILPSDCGIISNLSALHEAFGLKKHKNAPQAKVTGGSDFKLGPIPWQASLRIKSHAGKSVHWCGAVILSPLLALTAGHCLQDYAKDAYIVRVGDYDTAMDEGTEQEITIEEVYLHEDFNQGLYLNHDIAIIKLKGRGIRFGNYAHAACLPIQEDNDARKGKWGDTDTSSGCIISGWGSIGGTGAGYSRTLHSAVVPLIAPSICQASHVYGKEAIGKGMGCAGSLTEGGADACQGDSGGPLICFEKGKPVLYGITSWGQGCGRANKPGVYSRVAYYRKWIDQKIHEAMSAM